MTQRLTRFFRSVVALACAASILLASPGLAGYAAAAQLGRPGAPARVVHGGATGAHAGALLGGSLLPLALSGPTASLTPAPLLAAPLGAAPGVLAAQPVAPVLPSAPGAPALPAPVQSPFASLTEPAAPASQPRSILQTLAEAFRPAAKPEAPILPAVSNALFDGSKLSGQDVFSKSDGSLGTQDTTKPLARPAGKGIADAVAAEDQENVPAPKKAAPAAAKKASAWVRFGVPAAVAVAAIALFHANLIPVAVISGSLLVSVLMHETAHLLGLRIWGDNTPKAAGRDSLNPLRNISMVGTILVPAVSLLVSMGTIGFPLLFGWAKPVPVDFNNLKNPKKDAAKVALLGPAMNLAIAAVAGAAMLAFPLSGTALLVAATLFKMNLALTVFNLLPLPQLDGGKLLVSFLPKSAYARWIHNPNLKEGYQGFYQRIYEGPANLLSKLHVHSLEHVNGLTRVVSLAALGAFYALFFSVLQVPLLFLALPCSYDYWCIREKVRSEAAVKDLMDLMSQWSAVIVQISEDLGVESEVSAYETEHAMKNALETLIDEQMEKDAFKALSDEDKIVEIMRLYPEKAAQFMKDKAMTEDTLETILKVLKDSRNDVYYERLKAWMKDHEIFKRWGNAHTKEKLKDSLKEAGNDKTKGKGGSGGAALMGLGAFFLTAAASAFNPFAFLAMGGTLGGAELPSTDKLVSGTPETTPAVEFMQVRFGQGVSEADATLFLGRQGLMIYESLGGGLWRLRLDAEGSPALMARQLSASAMVAELTVHPDVYSVVSPAAAQPELPFAWDEKIAGRGTGAPEAEVLVRLAQGVAAEQAETLLAGYGRPRAGTGTETGAYVFTASDLREAAEMARGLAGLAQVGSVAVSDAVRSALLPGAAPAAPAAAPAPSPLLKVTSYGPGRYSSMYLSVTFEDGASPEAIRALLAGAERSFRPSPSNEKLYGVFGRTLEQTAQLARALAADALVRSVQVHPAVEALFADERGAFDSPAVTAVPVSESLAKVSSHGRDHNSPTVVFVRFIEGTTEARITGLLRARGQNTLFHDADGYTVAARGVEEAAELAALMAENSAVADVKVHPAVDALLNGRTVPSVGASFDHSRALLVRFKPGVPVETMRDYAQVRGLRLVDSEFRGGEGLALMEVAQDADVAAKLAEYQGELGVEHSPVEAIGRFKEQGLPAVPVLPPAPVEPPKPVMPSKRMVEAEWQNFLNTRVLSDGKSTLTPKQVQFLSMFIKPVKGKTDAPTPPVVGRTEEIKRIMPILSSPRGMRNSVVLIGEAGVGKTAVAEGLAELIEEAEHAAAVGAAGLPTADFLDFKRMKGRWLVELDLNALLTAEDPVGTLNALLQLLPLLNDPEPGHGNKLIVLVDEIQKLFMDSSGVKMANAMKGILRDGRLSVLATTTEKEFKKWIESDDAFRRRLEVVRVEEPTVEQTIAMLRGAKTFLEKLHDAVIPDATLVAAAKLHAQFDKTNFNPDKSFKGVQDAAELSRPDNLRSAIALDIRETWRALEIALNEARQALLDKGIASVLALPPETYNHLVALAQQAEALYASMAAVQDGKSTVTADVIKRSLSIKTGISGGQLTLGEEDAGRYVHMEAEIAKRVVSQEKAIRALANAIRRNKAGISNPNRPMAKFMLVGPTGTGKTYIAKELARFLFHDPEAVVRLDMSEYQQDHEVSKMIGSPPGYVGYGEGGQLTEKVRKKPYSVVLFDEIEKAHPKVWDVLLQILDEGRLTDGEGRTIDFKNTVILMSSNTGMAGVDGEKYEKLLEATSDPLERAKIEAAWDEDIATAIKEGIKDRFRPEFINRLDEDPSSKNKWITFERLKPGDMAAIAKIQLGEFVRLLKERHDTDLVFSDEALDVLRRVGYSPLYGARPMQGAIDKYIVDPLAKWILTEAESGNTTVRGGLIRIGVKDGDLVFTALPKPVKVVERSAVAGAAESLVQGVLSLVEDLAAGKEGATEPSQALFESFLKGPVQPRTPQAQAKPSSGFSPGDGLTLPAAARTVAAAHNKANKKDDAMRYEAKGLVAAAGEAGWPKAVVDALDTGEGVGVGWLKHFIRHAKDRATKAGIEGPITLTSQVDQDHIRLVIRSAHALSDEEAAVLSAHFSAAPSVSFLAAQQLADNLNLSSAMVWDHNLLDLYRRLSAIPGARFGFSRSGAGGTDYWLDIPRDGPPPGVQAAAGLTPHRIKENAKTRSLMLRVVEQNGLTHAEQDGPAVKVAAARGFALLSGPEQADEARRWLRDGGFARREGTEEMIQNAWAKILTAVLVLGRFGTAADIPTVEALARKLRTSAHAFVPLHNAFAETLAELYERAGLPEVREVLARRTLENGDIQAAAERALERLRPLARSIDDHVGDAEALAIRFKRYRDHNPIMRQWRLELAGNTALWQEEKASTRIAVLAMVSADPAPAADILPTLVKMLEGQGSDRVTRYAVAEAFASIVARENLVQGLPQALEAYASRHKLTDYDSETWQILLAYVKTLELAGGPENLALLEELMKSEPGSIASVHEQAYFSTPWAWAQTLVRSGLFAESSAKLQEMLASRKPMLAAAALYAIALSQSGLGGPAVSSSPSPAPGPLPPLKDSSGSSGGYSRGYGYGFF